VVRLPSRTVLGLALTLAAVAPAYLLAMPEERPKPRGGAEVAPVRGQIAFEANKGQMDPRVRYMSRGAGYALFLTDDESVLTLSRGKSRSAAVLRTRLAGASPRRARGEALLPGRVNIYKGSERHEGIRTYGRVRYGSPYPGIDLVYYGRDGALEYDFEVRPGADPTRIGLELAGARKLSLSPRGDLLIGVPGGTVRHKRPVAYQEIEGRRVNVGASFDLAGRRVGFRLGDYDRSRKLVIDPVLAYSSYLGGSAEDTPVKMALGPDKSVYITGNTFSNNFPGTSRSPRADLDAFVTRLNHDGSRVYSTYVGGTAFDQAFDIAVDSSGRAYAVGNTESTNFAGFALDTCDSDGGSSGWIARLSADGGDVYQSCLGGNGNDFVTGIAVREPNASTVEAYLVGTTTSAGLFTQNTGIGWTEFFPNAYQSTCCFGQGAFLIKLNFADSITGSYGTFLDGASDDWGQAVAVDSAGRAYVATKSSSNPFPTGATAKPGAGTGVAITKLDPGQAGANSKIYSTWVDGSSDEEPRAVAVDSGGAAYVAGWTGSSNLPNPTTGAPFEYVGGDAGFISRIAANGSEVTKTIYLDGSGHLSLNDLALQEADGITSVYAVGDTDGTLSTVNPLSGQSCAAGNSQAVLAKVSESANPIGLYVTCLGGSGTDIANGVAVAPTGTDAWITGTTTGSFPTVAAKQGTAGSGLDGFVARIGRQTPVIDSGPGEGAVIPSGDATFTFSTAEPGLTFRCSAPDAGKLVAGSALGTCSGAGTATYSGLANGQHTFEVATVDGAGAESARATRTFTVDSNPPRASYVIAPNPVLVGRPAAFDAGGSTSPSGTIVRYEWDLDGDGSFETDTGGSATASRTYTAPGTVNTALRVTDSTGASASASVQLLVTDPSSLGTQVGVSINKGAQYTNKPDVTLTVVPPASATALLVANDGGFVGALPRPVTAEVKWRLDSSGPERLPKTVYLRFLLGTLASSNYTDDIILDERPPVVNSAALATPAAASGARAAALKRYRLRIRATDTNSGVGHVQVTSNKRRPGKLIRYKRKLTVRAAKRPRFIRARDRAGNFSKWKKLR